MAFLLLFLLLHRQNVVVVGAGRTSRSARIATSSELLYLLNLLYNTPSECCDEYKLIQLYQKSSVWCFASSHTSTFELIPAVAMAQPGAMVTVLRWISVKKTIRSFIYKEYKNPDFRLIFALCRKRCKVCSQVQWKTDRKSSTWYWLVPVLIGLTDLDRQMTDGALIDDTCRPYLENGAIYGHRNNHQQKTTSEETNTKSYKY